MLIIGIIIDVRIHIVIIHGNIIRTIVAAPNVIIAKAVKAVSTIELKIGEVKSLKPVKLESAVRAGAARKIALRIRVIPLFRINSKDEKYVNPSYAVYKKFSLLRRD